MVAVASRAALMGDETHDAWVGVFAAIMKPPPDSKRAACPNCGHFSVVFKYVADKGSRVGLCAIWCGHCGHGHTLSRVQVPEGVEFVPLDSPDEVLREAIPAFYDAAAHESQFATGSDPASAARLAPSRPDVAGLLSLTGVGAEQGQHLLSPREREVIGLLVDGRTVTEIAVSLHISPTTVRSHMQRVYWKLGRAADRRALAPDGPRSGQASAGASDGDREGSGHQLRPSGSRVNMKRIDVVKRPDGWVGQSGGRMVPNTRASTKAEAVKKVAAAAKNSSQPVSVRIHKTDGKIQEERTYPRSADSRSSKH